MLLFDHHFVHPAENLACDEFLLNYCNDNNAPQLLRFWESPTYFVVLGYTKKRRHEVDIAKCEQQNIPILRRCSGGGTVLQGPGCLNYSLICKTPRAELPYDISATNRRVMAAQRDALQTLLRGRVEVCGYTDLTWNDRKFSGNAQRRKSRYFLFHGTILYNFDIALLQKVLLMPEVQPAYRAQRPHSVFVGNVPVARQAVQNAIMRQWNVKSTFKGDAPLRDVELLARNTYLSAEWNEKF